MFQFFQPPTKLEFGFLMDESWQIPRYERKITDYENTDQRLMGQAYCPSHKIMLPGLIIPVCDSGTPGLTQNLLLYTLYTLFNGFMSVFSLLSLFGPPEITSTSVTS